MNNMIMLESNLTIDERRGQHIAAARKRAKKRQADVATILGVDISTYQRYESGSLHISDEAVIKLSAVYGDYELPIHCLAEYQLWKHCFPEVEFSHPEGDAAMLLDARITLSDSFYQRLILEAIINHPNGINAEEWGYLEKFCEKLLVSLISLRAYIQNYKED